MKYLAILLFMFATNSFAESKTCDCSEPVYYSDQYCVAICGHPLTAVVLYSDFKPMSFDVDGKPTGFDIELWEAIAADIGVKTEYKKVHFQSIIHELGLKHADVGLAGITMTAEREEKIDFSHAYFQSGLRLLTRLDKQVDIITSTSLILSDKKMLKAFIYFMLFLFVGGHILYFAEKGNNEGIIDSYFPGIFEAFWCVFATMTTVGYGDIAPKRWLGRGITALIGIGGIAFFGWFIAVFAGSMAKLEDDVQLTRIESPTELKGFTIATKGSTTSAQAIVKYGGKLIQSSDISESYLKLALKEVDGVLFDSPSVLHRLQSDKSNEFTTVGELIEKQSYGFALQQNSELREDINRSLLKLQHNGTYDKIYNKWFGSK